MSFFPVPVIHPELYTRHILELWQYRWNPAREDYDRVSYQVVQIAEPINNPVPNVNGLNSNNPAHPIRLEALRPEIRALLQPHRETGPEPPRRPITPVFGSSANPIVVMENAETSHVRLFESPASPDPSPPTSPVNTPTKRPAPSPPVSPSKVRCDNRPRYVEMQDHQFEGSQCPLPSSPTLNGYFDLGFHGEVWPSERLPPSLRPSPRQRSPAPAPPSSSATELSPRARRPAPSPPSTAAAARRLPTSRPQQRGRTTTATAARVSPYPIPSEESAFSSTLPRARNLFSDFIPTLPRPFPIPGRSRSSPPTPVAPPSPEIPPPPRVPSPDIMLELYSHTRHPLDLRTHLTILPSWAEKAEKELEGDCIICYGDEEHLQIRCKNCHTMKVCCTCVVGVYQSINSCPVCRFRGEY